MAIFYIDPEGEAGDGTGSSFANRASGMDSANSTIRSSYAAGDEIRVKKSPDPTSLGTCIVNNKNPDNSYYRSNLSLVSFSTTAGASVFSKSNHRLVTGDFIYITNESSLSTHRIQGLWKVTVTSTYEFKLDGYVGPSSGSISGAKFKIMTSNVLELNTSNITKVLLGGNDSDYSGNVVPSWTVNGSNCTYTQVNGNNNSEWSGNMEVLYPPVSHKFVVSGDATDGTKLAHFQLDASTDLSAFQQISVLWMQTSGSPEKGGNIKLCLCSDTSGDTVVDSTTAFDVTSNNQNSWNTGYTPITYNKGSALGSGIQSVALYVDDQDDNNQECIYYLSSVIASKSTSSNDCLTYNSVVGFQTTAEPYWYSVGWIRGNYILCQVSDNPNRRWFSSYYTGGGYFRPASNNSATLYVRQPMYLGDLREANATQGLGTGIIYFNSNTNGTSSNPISVSGGWDTTAMSSQTGETFIDGQLWKNYLIRVQSVAYVSISKISPIRFYYGAYIQTASYFSLTDCYPIENSSNGLYVTSSENLLKLKAYVAMSTNGSCISINSGTTTSATSTRSDFVLKCNLSQHIRPAIRIQGSGLDVTFEEIDVRGNANLGLQIYSGAKVYVHNFYGGYYGDTYSGSGGADVSTSQGTAGKVEIGTGYFGLHASMGYAIDDKTGIIVNKVVHTAWLNGDGSIDTNKTCGNASSNFARFGGTTPAVLGASGDSECHGAITFQNSGKVRTHDLTFNNSGTLYSSSSIGSAEISDYDGTAGDVRTFYQNNNVLKETTTTQPGSGTAWKQELNSSLGTLSTTPEEFPIGKIAVNGGSQVTVSIYVRRSSTNVFPGVHVKANSLIGVSDTSAYITAAADTWQQISANFTPTGAGIVEITLGAYRAGSGDSFYDTFSVTQA